MPATQSIDDIIRELESAMDRCELQQSCIGYFAALYGCVTVRVRDGIRAGEFEDCPRMERLDVIFARRYLDALALHWEGKPATRSWDVAFRSAAERPLTVAQHLLLGINAHINLDLAIAAAQTAPGTALPALRRDFERISDILGEMIEQMQERIARVSPWFRLIDLVGGRRDERLVGFGIRESRRLSWQAAELLARTPAAHFDAQVALHDVAVAGLAQAILRPGRLLGTALRVVRARERAGVPAVIRALRG